MLDEKGQHAMEIIIIAVVLLGLVLATSAVMMQRNVDANRILGIRRDTIECHRISGIITGLSASSGYGEAKLQRLEKTVRIEKGSIVIEGYSGRSISCRYSGTAWLEEQEGQYWQDLEGFDLVKEKAGSGVTYKAKRLGMGVVFCDYAETWC